MTPQKNLICLLNGTLDPLTCELHSHSPDHRLLNQLPIEWDPEAKCELWDQTLHEVFQDDPDCKEKIRFLQEWFGYCLIPDTNQHKMVWMVSAGANVKSLINCF